MAEKKALHSLIHALTPSEKRYFHLFSALQKKVGRQTNYQLLFDLIQEQEIYDEAALHEALKGQSLLKHLSSERNYLYRLILKAMRNYRAERKGAQRARDLLSEAEFLYDKSLFKQSYKQLLRARKIALEMEDAPRLLEVQKLEGKLLKRLLPKDYDVQMQKLHALNEVMLEQIEVENRLLALYNLLFRQYSKREMTGKSLVSLHELTWLEKLKLSDLPSFHATHLYFQVQALHASVRGDQKEAMEWIARNTRSWNDHASFQGYFPLKYSLVLSNFLNSAMEANVLEEVPEILDRLRRHQTQSETHARFTLSNFYFYRLLWQLRIHRIKEADDSFPELESWLNNEANSVQPARFQAFLINMALVHLYSGDYRPGLKKVHELLNAQSKILRTDFHLLGRLLQLIFLWELGDTEQFQLRMRAVQRFSNGNSLIESWVFNFLKGMRTANASPVENWPEVWRSMIRQMEHYQKSENSQPQGGFNEALHWLHAKDQNCLGAEIYPTSLLAE